MKIRTLFYAFFGLYAVVAGILAYNEWKGQVLAGGCYAMPGLILILAILGIVLTNKAFPANKM